MLILLSYHVIKKLLIGENYRVCPNIPFKIINNCLFSPNLIVLAYFPYPYGWVGGGMGEGDLRPPSPVMCKSHEL